MSALHHFDLLLCDYVHWNIHQHLDDRQFAKCLSSLDPRLAECVKTVQRTKPVPISEMKLVFNDQELAELERAVSDSTTLKHWQPSLPVHEQVVQCTGEISRLLTKTDAERWASESSRLAERLEAERLPLEEGIGIVAQWLGELRRYLNAIDRVDLLPALTGGLSTPTCTGVLPSPQRGEKLSDVERMRLAIQKHPNGKNTKPSALIKLATIGNQRGREALRALAAIGEYTGFGRSKAEPRSGSGEP